MAIHSDMAGHARQDLLDALNSDVTDVGELEQAATRIDGSFGSTDGEISRSDALPLDGGSFGDSIDFHLTDGGVTDEIPACPGNYNSDACLFPGTSNILLQDRAFDIMEVSRLLRPDDFSQVSEAQLLYGFACDGNFQPETLSDALRLTDDGILLLRVIHLESGRSFDWYRFYMGDTEIGFIYARGTLRMAALIGDQDISHCQTVASGPDR